MDKSKIDYFKVQLQNTNILEKNEFSLLNHTIHEHYNSSPSILLVGGNDILNELKIFYNDITLFNSKSLNLYDKIFDVIIFNSNDYLINNLFLYKILVLYNTHKKSLICIRNIEYSEDIKDLSEFFKLDKNLSYIIRFNEEIKTDVFIKEPNFALSLNSSKLNNLALKIINTPPDKETLLVLFDLIKGINVTLKDNIKINFSTIINVKEVKVDILDKTKNLIYSTQIDIEPQINYWFIPNNNNYLNGFFLILSKNNFTIYKKFFPIKKNKILK